MINRFILRAMRESNANGDMFPIDPPQFGDDPIADKRRRSEFVGFILESLRLTLPEASTTERLQLREFSKILIERIERRELSLTEMYSQNLTYGQWEPTRNPFGEHASMISDAIAMATKINIAIRRQELGIDKKWVLKD